MYPEGLKTALIKWENNFPLSALYRDIYFPRKEPLAFAEKVFLEGTNLLEKSKKINPLTVGEIGFGAGINFLVTVKTFLQKAPSSAALSFYSVESLPLSHSDIKKILSLFPSLSPYKERLLEIYPPAVKGFYTLCFHPRISLRLIFNDALKGLKELEGFVDCWYLDGHAPYLNSSAWSRELISKIASKSKKNATVATWSVARQVKEALLENNFKIEIVKGFAEKKEVLKGVFKGDSLFKESTLKQITVIGAGISGASTAFHLAKKGALVTLIEEDRSPANKASGNQKGLSMPYLSFVSNPLSLLVWKGHIYLLSLLKNTECLNVTGAVQLLSRKRLEEMYEKKELCTLPSEVVQFLTKEELSSISKINVAYPAFYFPLGCIIYPKKIINWLLCQHKIEILTSRKVASITISQSKILCHTNKETIKSDGVVIACGDKSSSFDISKWLPIEPVHGQIAKIPSVKESFSLKTPVAFDGYLLPQENNYHIVGASYRHNVSNLGVIKEDLDDIKKRLLKWFPFFKEEKLFDARASFRASTYDRMPYVGNIPLINNSFKILDTPPLYTVCGTASRGFALALLFGELLSSIILNQPLPLEKKLCNCLTPARALAYLRKKSAG
ncbi:MAG: FAD-dependent oxidoreductase [Candidatus Dadabacteria bacterium]|nr:MAG: FAD-dependent oxidoreductase [Candidatus Dadabacteria bacterium]